MEQAALLIFVRLPVLGRVKTRLAKGAGPVAARNFYDACASYTLQLAHSCAAVRAAVHYSSADSEQDMQAWMHFLGLGAGSKLGGVRLVPQCPDPDLGAKLLHALRQEMAQPGMQKAIVMGSDIPGVTAQVLHAAVRALDAFEVVIGPAVDGGYYLLGVRGPRVEDALFWGVAWSTDQVLAQTVERAEAAGLSVAPLGTLPVLQDVDTLEDLRAWHAQEQGAAGAQEGRAGAQQEQQQEQQEGLPDALAQAAATAAAARAVLLGVVVAVVDGGDGEGAAVHGGLASARLGFGGG